MSSETYFRPRSVDEALHLVAQGDSEVLAGGTYLIGNRRRRTARLIDLERLGLDYVSEDEAGVNFGAMTRLQNLVDHELFKRSSLFVLSEAAHSTRPSWMLRNMSTIGGEIVQRSRHSSLIVALLALDAEVTFATTGAERRMSLNDFYRERISGTLPLVLTEVSIPASKAGARVAFRQISQLPSQEPITTAAVSLLTDGSGARETRAALGSSVDVPQRLGFFEQTFSFDGPSLDAEDLRDYCRTALQDVEFGGGHYRSVDYLREVSGLLLTRICLELLQKEHVESNGHSH